MSLSSAAWLRLLAVLLLAYMVWQASAILLPLLLGTILAFVLQPLVRLLTRIPLWPGSRRTVPLQLAILLSFFVAAVVLTAVVAYIFMPFVGEFNQFMLNLPKLTERIRQLIFSLGIPLQTTDLPENIRVMIDNNLSNAAAYSLDLARRLLNATVGFAGRVIELIVVPVLAFYFLKDWPQLRNHFVAIFPAALHKKVRMIVD